MVCTGSWKEIISNRGSPLKQYSKPAVSIESEVLRYRSELQNVLVWIKSIKESLFIAHPTAWIIYLFQVKVEFKLNKQK